MNEGDIALTIEGLAVRRGGRDLLAGVDLQVRGGEVIALVGPNGAGKSTLMAAIAGDLEPSSGTIRLFGRELGAWSVGELALARAVLPQQTILQFGFTAREVVAMGRAPLPPDDRRQDDEAIAFALSKTEALHLAERRFPTLSGGEQTRVSLARVLAQETRIVLLDEPTAALDIRHQQLVMLRARALAGRGKAVIAILHDLNLAMAHADRVAVLANGSVRAFGTPWEVAADGLLADVFRCPVAIARHPAQDRPLVIPLGDLDVEDVASVAPAAEFASLD
ncbi:MAG: heme ABC transporter ATP-binding protein [Thermomicrobiales bacterium]